MRYISYAKRVETFLFSVSTHLDCWHLYVVSVVSSTMAGHRSIRWYTPGTIYLRWLNARYQVLCVKYINVVTRYNIYLLLGLGWLVCVVLFYLG